MIHPDLEPTNHNDRPPAIDDDYWNGPTDDSILTFPVERTTLPKELIQLNHEIARGDIHGPMTPEILELLNKRKSKQRYVEYYEEERRFLFAGGATQPKDH